jgi:hypothetical protein
MRSITHGIGMTLVLYEMWDSTAWDWQLSSTTVIEGAKKLKLCNREIIQFEEWSEQILVSCRGSVDGMEILIWGGGEAAWFAWSQRGKSSEVTLGEYWILSLTPSLFSGYLTKLLQVMKLNSVNIL